MISLLLLNLHNLLARGKNKKKLYMYRLASGVHVANLKAVFKRQKWAVLWDFRVELCCAANGAAFYPERIVQLSSVKN